LAGFSGVQSAAQHDLQSGLAAGQRDPPLHLRLRQPAAAPDILLPKSFLTSVIDHIDVDDDRVVSITFKNSIEHRFIYKA